jgi:hypothetical protein
VIGWSCEADEDRLGRELAVVPEDVVHPALLGGWELPSTPVLRRRGPDEAAR